MIEESEDGECRKLRFQIIGSKMLLVAGSIVRLRVLLLKQRSL